MPTGDSGVSGHRKSTRHHSLLMEPKVRNLRRHRSLDRLIEVYTRVYCRLSSYYVLCCLV